MTHGDILYFEEEDRRESEKLYKEKNEIKEEVRREIGSEIYVMLSYFFLFCNNYDNNSPFCTGKAKRIT